MCMKSLSNPVPWYRPNFNLFCTCDCTHEHTSTVHGLKYAQNCACFMCQCQLCDCHVFYTKSPMFVRVCGISSMKVSVFLFGPWPGPPWCAGGHLLGPWPGPPWCGSGILLGPWPVNSEMYCLLATSLPETHKPLMCYYGINYCWCNFLCNMFYELIS